ncbi:MAG: cytochrome c3 family protein [Sphingopyxis sp.]
MSFLLRRVSVTSAGREIIRSTPLVQREIAVGRDASSDIHLADLAVIPHHATITSNDGRHIEVQATTGLGFEWDGRTVTRASIDAGDGAELRFGGHRITVGLDSETADSRVTLTVTRTDELSHSALDRDEGRAFSLRGKLPGRRLSAWAFALLVIGAFLIAPIFAYMQWRGIEERPATFHADQSWSSGPLSSVHAALARDCQSCHTDAFVAVTDQACKSCHDDAHDHAPINRQLAARGEPGMFRGVLNRIGAAFNRTQGRCVDCHNEHEGAGPMPATAQAFCADCHNGMSSRLTDTRIGDAGDFGTSHPQFRPRVQVAPGAAPRFVRTTLTPQTTDINGLKFPHNMHLQQAGGVARMARHLRLNAGQQSGLDCANCHRPTADGVRFEPVDMERDCQGCHSLSFESVGGVTRTLRHGEPAQVVADLYAYYRSTPPTRPISLGGMARRRPGEFAQGQIYNIYFRETTVRPTRANDAVRAVFSRGGACYDCHTIFAPAAGNSNWRVLPVTQTARYLEHGWFDHRPHNDEPCSTCHLAARSSSANQLLIPEIKVCRDCHGGENSGADVESPCASCHEYHAGERADAPWQPPQSSDRRQRGGRGPAGREQSGRVISITDSDRQR